MLSYVITPTEVSSWVYVVDIDIVDDQGNQIYDAQTYIGVNNDTDAITYATNVFLPDLIRNNERLLGSLVISGNPSGN
jgi:hypothetical protein